MQKNPRAIVRVITTIMMIITAMVETTGQTMGRLVAKHNTTMMTTIQSKLSLIIRSSEFTL